MCYSLHRAGYAARYKLHAYCCLVAVIYLVSYTHLALLALLYICKAVFLIFYIETALLFLP